MNHKKNQTTNITVINVITFPSVNIKHTTESGKILTLSDKRLTYYA